MKLPLLGGKYKAERVWAQRLDSQRARILTVVRYDAEAQHGDIVRYQGEDFTEVLQRSGLTMHEVSGGMTSTIEAMNLTTYLRSRQLVIEVWSWTMGDGFTAPLRAGLMVSDPAAAVAALSGLPLYYPTLLAAVGDELGARRHARTLQSRPGF